MNIPSELVAGIAVLSIGGAGAWIQSVEQRLAHTAAIIAKVDELVSLMLEDRLTTRS